MRATVSEPRPEVTSQAEASQPKRERNLTPAWVVLAIGVLASLASLSHPSGSVQLAAWGPLPPLTIFWYVGLIATAMVFLYGVVRQGLPPTTLLAVALGTLLLLLHGISLFAVSPPPLAWLPKNADFTRYIVDHGSIGPSDDVYHRWPGAFALNALLTQLGGFTNPIDFAIGTQLFSASLLALLIFALAMTMYSDKRAAWAAVFVFSLANWTAHLHYAPQPISLSMHLGILLLVLRYFRRRSNQMGRRNEGLVGQPASSENLLSGLAVSPAARSVSLACIFLIHAASTIAHPFAPLITILAVAILLVLGYLRSWLLLAGLVVLTVSYLLLNVGHLGSDYSLGVDLDPSAHGLSTVVLSLVVGILTIPAIVAWWRRGGRLALLCAGMVAGPILLSLVRSGPEARFQTAWYALPWCAIAIGWLIADIAVKVAVRDQRSLRLSVGTSVAETPNAETPRAPTPNSPTANAHTTSAHATSAHATSAHTTSAHTTSALTDSEPGLRWETKASLALSLTLVAAVLTMTLALGRVPRGRLTDYGLPPALPLAWYVGLAVLVFSSVGVLAFGRIRHWLAFLHLVGLIYVLYGSGVILSRVPRFAWSYKHIGVTRYITKFGTVDPSVDIYHRWPGFFSLASFFGTVAGLPDPVSYAAWVGVFFVVLQSVLVVAIARTLLRSTRSAWAAGLIFACINWVGQDYFAPQPFTFALALGVMWLTLLHFRSTPRGPIARFGTRLLSQVARTGNHSDIEVAPEPLWRRRVTFTMIIVIFVAIVPSHQLTPYFVVLTVAALSITGAVRTKWLPVVLLLIAVSFLVPNFAYVQQHYSVFSGLDPLSNAHPVNALDHVQPGKVFNVRAGLLLSIVFSLLAFMGLIRGWRRQTVGVFHAAMAFAAPVLILLTQSYGGEGGLRVILFAAPWAAVLIAAGLRMRRGKKALVLAPVLVAFLVLFLPSYYGVEEINQIPEGEVVASDFLYNNGEAGSILVSSAPNFPLRIGERYPTFRGPRSDADQNLMRRAQFRNRPLGPADVDAVVNIIHRYGKKGYVIFSDSQETYATVFGTTTVKDLRSLEQALLSSGRFQVFYQNDTTRIYQLVA